MTNTRAASSPSPHTSHADADVHTTTAEPLAFVLIKLGRLVERHLNQSDTGQALTTSQILILNLIARHPHASRADVARGVFVSPQAVGGSVAQLLEMSAISRAEPSPGTPHEYLATDGVLRHLLQHLATDLNSESVRANTHRT